MIRTSECLAERIGDSGHEQEHSHDERLHVRRRLRERVLEPGDGREDLRECDEHIRSSLDPHVQV